MGRERTRGRAVWALAGSLALHGGALLWLARGRSAQQLPAPISAAVSPTRVLLFDAVTSPAPAVSPAPALSPGGKRIPGPARAVTRSYAPESEPPRSEPAPAAAPPEAEPPEVGPPTGSDPGEGLAASAAPGIAEPPGEHGGGAPGPAVAANGAAGPSSGLGSGSAAPGGGGPSPALAALHQRLAAAALRCYPEAARRFRTRGEVVVSFCLDPAGHAQQVTPVASSGSALLDRAATDCVLPGALPMPGAAGCYRVPVVFGGP